MQRNIPSPAIEDDELLDMCGLTAADLEAIDAEPAIVISSDLLLALIDTGDLALLRPSAISFPRFLAA